MTEMRTIEYTAALRARIYDAIQSERESWDDDTHTDILILSVLTVPLGTLDIPTDIDDIDEDRMSAAETIALQIAYFGIDA